MDRRSTAALIVSFTLATGGWAGADCTKDTECKGDRIGKDGHCIDPPRITNCDKDTDCAGDAICDHAQCVNHATTVTREFPPDDPRRDSTTTYSQPPPPSNHTRDGDTVSVTFEGTGLAKVGRERCDAPCRVDVPRGTYHFSLGSQSATDVKLTEPVRVRVRHTRVPVPLFFGVGLLVVASVLAPAAFAVGASEDAQYARCSGYECQHGTIGVDLEIAAGVSAGVGTLMLVFGLVEFATNKRLRVDAAHGSMALRLRSWTSVMARGSATGLSFDF